MDYKYRVGDEYRITRDCEHYKRKYKKGEIVIVSSDIYGCCDPMFEMPIRRPDEPFVYAFGIPYKDLKVVGTRDYAYV